jgi:hypothetical protein
MAYSLTSMVDDVQLTSVSLLELHAKIFPTYYTTTQSNRSTMSIIFCATSEHVPSRRYGW